jgi:hypothetical protein
MTSARRLGKCSAFERLRPHDMITEASPFRTLTNHELSSRRPREVADPRSASITKRPRRK